MERVRYRGTWDPVLKSSGFLSTFTVCEGTVQCSGLVNSFGIKGEWRQERPRKTSHLAGCVCCAGCHGIQDEAHQAVVVLAFSPSLQKAEIGGSLGSRPA